MSVERFFILCGRAACRRYYAKLDLLRDRYPITKLFLLFFGDVSIMILHDLVVLFGFISRRNVPILCPFLYHSQHVCKIS